MLPNVFLNCLKQFISPKLSGGAKNIPVPLLRKDFCTFTNVARHGGSGDRRTAV
jgi:hypothetical protein